VACGNLSKAILRQRGRQSTLGKVQLNTIPHVKDAFRGVLAIKVRVFVRGPAHKGFDVATVHPLLMFRV
jgi:hypothetical protein